MVDNPWVRSAPSEVSSAEIAEPPRDQAQVRPNVVSPQDGVRVPDLADRIGQQWVQQGATMWWLGVTGGAGESTLEKLAPGSRGAGRVWPMPSFPGMTSRVTLVARTNYAGLAAAQRAAIEWASGVLGDSVRVEGLILVPDAPGRLPKQLRHLAQVVSGGLPHVWTLPWVDEWRFGPLESAQSLPKEFPALFADLHLSPQSPNPERA